MDLHDDALGLVLERVGSHVSLIRAAAVCRRWRRAIADPAFLRRFRSLHAPAVAGVYHNPSPFAHLRVGARASDGPAFHPSSPPMVDARHFSLDFLPDGARSWTILDSRGSLLIVRDRTGRFASPGMVVCEPLTRRCEIIPPPVGLQWGGFFFSCLVDGYANDNEASGHISMSNFRVLCMFKRDGVMHATMFTVGSSWSNKNVGHIAPNLQWLYFLGRAGGSCYFKVEGRRILVELDGSTGDFTSSVIPAIEESDQRCKYHVTEGRDGKPRLLTVFNNTLWVFVRLHSGEWALENSVMLSEATHGLPGYQPSFFIIGQHILTRGTGFVTLLPLFGVQWLYSIDLETMEAEPTTGDMGPIEYRYELPWPPALHACIDI